MAWTAPITFTPNSILTAAQLNTYLRDNLNETYPAKVTAAGQYLVSTGTTAVAKRDMVKALTAGPHTTSSTSFVDLTSPPAVTTTTGTTALVILTCGFENNTANSFCRVSYRVSGATTIASTDNYSLAQQDPGAANGFQGSMFHYQAGLTAGSNTFTMQARVEAGTGTFSNREVIVFPF